MKSKQNQDETVALIELEAKGQGVWNLILDQAELIRKLDPTITYTESIIQASVHIIK